MPKKINGGWSAKMEPPGGIFAFRSAPLNFCTPKPEDSFQERYFCPRNSAKNRSAPLHSIFALRKKKSVLIRHGRDCSIPGIHFLVSRFLIKPGRGDAFRFCEKGDAVFAHDVQIPEE